MAETFSSSFSHKLTEPIEKYYTMTTEVLGKGYFAVVRVGISKETGEKVAVKLINKKLVEREETLYNEIEILSTVNHKHIVKMFDVFDTPETLFIVMELMSGGELYEKIIEKSTFTEKEASAIMKQLLDALQYCHKLGIVHRDLKLENLLLADENGTDIRLADFGLSKIFTENSLEAYTACGTPFYVAPDILLATEGTGYGPAVDMWATGVLCYILLSGRLPFSGEEDTDLFDNIIDAPVEWKSPQFDNVSESAKDFISKLLDKNPKTRMTADDAFKHLFIQNNTSSATLHSTLAGGLRRLSTLSKAKLAEKEKEK